MKKRITILMVGAVLALLVMTALVSASPISTVGSSTTSGTLSGGHYRWTTTSLPVNSLASGGPYRLMPAVPAINPAAGCCCKTNLPCVLR